MVEQFVNAKMAGQLKKLKNQVDLESGPSEQIVSHPGCELDLNGLEAPDELHINTVTQQATQQNPEKPKPTCHHCKKPSHYWNQCRQLKREKEQGQNNSVSAGNNNK